VEKDKVPEGEWREDSEGGEEEKLMTWVGGEANKLGYGRSLAIADLEGSLDNK